MSAQPSHWGQYWDIFIRSVGLVKKDPLVLGPYLLYTAIFITIGELLPNAWDTEPLQWGFSSLDWIVETWVAGLSLIFIFQLSQGRDLDVLGALRKNTRNVWRLWVLLVYQLIFSLIGVSVIVHAQSELLITPIQWAVIGSSVFLWLLLVLAPSIVVIEQASVLTAIRTSFRFWREKTRDMLVILVLLLQIKVLGIILAGSLIAVPRLGIALSIFVAQLTVLWGHSFLLNSTLHIQELWSSRLLDGARENDDA